MQPEITAGPVPATHSSVLRHLGASIAGIALRVFAISLVLLAVLVRRDPPYTSASVFAYWLGIIGGSMMLGLLIYPLRKRFRWLGFLGPLKHWFRFHLVAGIFGPVIVLFHSTFRVGSFNAAIALVCMLMVVASGLVGRFLYQKIHNGLYGSRATLETLQQSLAQQLTALQGQLARLPAVNREIQRYLKLVSLQPQGVWQRSRHFLSLGLKRKLTSRRVDRAIAGYDQTLAGGAVTHRNLLALANTIEETLGAMQRTAQFSTYERLFSLWHVVHMPFLLMLVTTAIVHVVAVHAY